MQTSGILAVLGLGCMLFGIIDFCGMFFHYDLTGLSFSPIIAGVIGGALVKEANRIETVQNQKKLEERMKKEAEKRNGQAENELN